MVDSHVDFVGCVVALSSDELLPGFVALVDDLGGISLVLGFTGESELVFGLLSHHKEDHAVSMLSYNRTA